MKFKFRFIPALLVLFGISLPAFALGNADALRRAETYVHPLYHQSASFKRVVRATYQAETYRMQLGVEHVDV